MQLKKISFNTLISSSTYLGESVILILKMWVFEDQKGILIKKIAATYAILLNVLNNVRLMEFSLNFS